MIIKTVTNRLGQFLIFLTQRFCVSISKYITASYNFEDTTEDIEIEAVSLDTTHGYSP